MFLPKLSEARHFCCMKKSGIIEFLALTSLTLPEGNQRNGGSLNGADHSYARMSKIKLCCPPNVCSHCTKHNNTGWTNAVSKRPNARQIKINRKRILQVNRADKNGPNVSSSCAEKEMIMFRMMMLDQVITVSQISADVLLTEVETFWNAEHFQEHPRARAHV